MAEKLADQAEAFFLRPCSLRRAQIVGARTDAFYIDRGENEGVAVGQRSEVRRAVDEIRDAGGNLPDTITDTVGLVEVSRVLGQWSVGTVIDGEAADGAPSDPSLRQEALGVGRSRPFRPVRRPR